ncbi:GpE family phage tail protein [Pseudomonas sp. 5P_3.1_Bac2]|nr:GpE family phage tail protein [Pseudomonas sp. 5P_3.1_Bac2]MCU1717435.1 GpE family phage tail protein [Pseudomonas sp. 5P_3.1_Bac2]
MADLAMVFHWSPADMNTLTLNDLMQWQERARTRWEHAHGH